MIPQVQLNQGDTEDRASGQVGIVVSPWISPNS